MIDQAKRLRSMMHGRSVNAINLGFNSQVNLAHSIAVSSGKGGVGKSNCAISLSISLSNTGKKVLLVDADLGLANLHIMLGIAPKYDLSHVIAGECTLEQVIIDGPGGVSIIPGASGFFSLANIESLKLEEFLRQLAQVESKYDYLLLDGGAGISEASIRLNCAANSVLLVITPDPSSLADAYAVVKILNQNSVQHIDVLVNMADTAALGREVFKKLQDLSINFLNKKLRLIGVLPFDKSVINAIRKQKSVVLEYPKSRVAYQFDSIARHISGLPEVAHGGFFNRIINRLNR